MSDILKITGYGDTAYYRTMEDALRDLHKIGGDHADIALTRRGHRIYDGPDIVGEVINEEAVPVDDRWQLEEAK